VVLQVRVDTGEEDIDLTTMAVLLSALSGDATLVQQLRLQLFHDTNANGSIDTGETLPATPITNGDQALRLQFTPPLLVPADTTTHLLVAVELSRGDGRTRTVPLSVFPPTVPPWLGGGLGLLAVLYACLRRRPRTLRVMLLLCMLGCVLFLTSCPEDGDDVLTATVVLPAQGVTGESETSGPLSGPTRPLRGASVFIVP
jgi:hypothetical protein